MSRRKDRERYESFKRLYPAYTGFRGYNVETERPGLTALQSVLCTICGHKRNVSPEVAEEQGEKYVCQSCQDAREG